jgi:hypothetical protein
MSPESLLFARTMRCASERGVMRKAVAISSVVSPHTSRKVSATRASAGDPFTITDAHSRYLIRCQIVSRMDLSQVRAICEAAMREYGVPARIRTDNGAPFAGTGLLGLSKLSPK